MRVTVSYSAYNERRYSRPWIAKVVNWPIGKQAELEFGRFLGQHGRAGDVEIEAEIGDIVRNGQKDGRSNNSIRDWSIVVNADGDLYRLSEATARQYWTAKQKGEGQAWLAAWVPEQDEKRRLKAEAKAAEEAKWAAIRAAREAEEAA